MLFGSEEALRLPRIHALPSVSCPPDGGTEHPLYLLFVGGFMIFINKLATQICLVRWISCKRSCEKFYNWPVRTCLTKHLSELQKGIMKWMKPPMNDKLIGCSVTPSSGTGK